MFEIVMKRVGFGGGNESDERDEESEFHVGKHVEGMIVSFETKNKASIV